MKTKLLRKVRKEFKIEYWPNGIDSSILLSNPLIRLQSNVPGKYRYFIITVPNVKYQGDFYSACKTKEEAIIKAKSRIISIIRDRYPNLGSYRKKFTKQQIWP